MTQIIDTVTEYEEKALDQLTQFQADVLEYLKKAVEAIETRIPESFEVPDYDFLDRIPTLSEVVDTQFAFGKKVLANQEKFAKNVVKTVKPLTREGLTKQTKSAPKAAA